MSSDQFKYFRLAKELNDRYKEVLKTHPARFRGSLNSICLVSLREDTPQLGIPCSFRRLEKATLSDIQQYLTKLEAKSAPRRRTSEKVLQSWIIRNAMNHYGLPFDDEIVFVTDEFAREVSNLRLVADIFGFIQSSNTFVIIELKSKRALKELAMQLDRCEALIRADTPFYVDLLKAHGFTWEVPYKVQKIAVWPFSKVPHMKRFKADIREICYKKEGQGFAFLETLETV